MTDLALAWDFEAMGADLVIEDGALLTDDGLRTACLISLFTDARARPGDKLPEGLDRRGWWGDATLEREGDETGSRLWLLVREKRLASVLPRARDYARAALAWLIEDGVAKTVDIEVELRGIDQLAIGVTLTRPDGPNRLRFDFVWDRVAELAAREERLAA